MNLYIKKQVNKEVNSLTCEMFNVVTLSEKTDLLLVDRSEMGFSNVKEGVNIKNTFFKIMKFIHAQVGYGFSIPHEFFF